MRIKTILIKLITLLTLFTHTGASAQDTLFIDLKDCIEIALKNNLQLKSVLIEEEKARAILNEAKGARYTNLSIKTGYSRISEVMDFEIEPQRIQIAPGNVFTFPGKRVIFGDNNNYETKLLFTQPIYTGERIGRRIEISRYNWEASKIGTLKERVDLTWKVTQAYHTHLKALRIREISSIALQQVESHLKDVRNFHEQGIAKLTDVLQVEVKKSQIELSMLKAQNMVEESRIALLNLMGIDLSTPIKIQEEIEFEESDYDLKSLMAKGIKKRLELKQIRNMINSSEAGIKLAEGARLPTISFVGVYEYGKPGLDKIENQWMGYWVVALSMEWNLWDW
ncbi:MAG: TolC family protein, partial [Fidelibacterota bacterium]